MSFDAALRLLRQTWDHPRETAAWVIAQGWSAGLSTTILALAAVVTTLLGTLAQLAAQRMMPGAPGDDPLMALFQTPLALAAVQLGAMLFIAVLIHRVGRLFGGSGSWAQTLSVVAFLQSVFTVLQAAQLLLALAVPILVLPVLLFSLFSVFFLTAHFTAALHGFTSVAKVLGGILLTLVLVILVASLLTAPFLTVPHV